MSKRCTTAEFKEKASLIHNNFYDYCESIYVGSKIKLIIICPEHGEFLQKPNDHLMNHGCPNCAGNIQYTLQEYIKKCNNKHFGIYDYSLVDYSGINNKIKIICFTHGEFLQTAKSHLAGSGCSKCYGNSKYTTEEFIKLSTNVHGDKYSYLKTLYNGVYKKVIITCSEHGDFLQEPHTHLSGSGCAKCWGMYLAVDDLIKKFKLIHGETYNYEKVNYTNGFIEVEIICKRHGSFFQKPKTHLRGHGCPKCKMSKAEFNISKYLEINNIQYLIQHKFNDCKNIFSLPFDFYLPEQNMCIEYDGEFHYISTNLNNDVEGQRFRDNIKTKYCFKNNIKLLRIKYTEYKNIQQILNESLDIF